MIGLAGQVCPLLALHRNPLCGGVSMRCVRESGAAHPGNAWYIHDLLEPLVAHVVVAHPYHVKLIAALSVKTDKRDTLAPSTSLRTGLARLLAANLIPAVWVPPACPVSMESTAKAPMTCHPIYFTLGSPRSAPHRSQ
jgi:hypothetical protein